MSSLRRFLPFGLALLLLAAPGAAQTPPETAAARQLGKEGVEAYRANDFATALDRLTRAHSIVGLTTTGLWRARTLVHLGRLVEASEQYLEVTRMTLPEDADALHRDAIGLAEEERLALLPRIPAITLTGALPDEAEVILDGRPVPRALLGAARPIDPGQHEVVVRRGDEEMARPLLLVEGQQLSVELTSPEPQTATVQPTVAPPARPAPSPLPAARAADEGTNTQQVLGWVAIGLGGAGLVVGAVTGGLGLKTKATLDEGCRDGRCPSALHDEVDAYGTYRGISIGGLVAGGVLAGLGIALLLTAPDEGDAAVSLRVGPASAGLVGCF